MAPPPTFLHSKRGAWLSDWHASNLGSIRGSLPVTKPRLLLSSLLWLKAAVGKPDLTLSPFVFHSWKGVPLFFLNLSLHSYAAQTPQGETICIVRFVFNLKFLFILDFLFYSFRARIYHSTCLSCRGLRSHLSVLLQVEVGVGKEKVVVRGRRRLNNMRNVAGIAAGERLCPGPNSWFNREIKLWSAVRGRCSG